jgi:Pyruvate/2-oxoacid:ferredoxin oxidoreductase delta subunit
MTNETPMHYVCTLQEAEALVRSHDRFWVSNCGCREDRGRCARSRIDVCLMFTEENQGSGSGTHSVTRKDVSDILKEARTKRLVSRPFRNEARTTTDGICFCCDDCCGYFLDPKEICDRGALIEMTDMELCTHCGVCADVCHFEARKIQDGRLVIQRENCYGCGLCVDICPEECVEMVERKQKEG